MSAVVLGVDVPEKSALAGVYVLEMGLPKGAVVSLVIRSGETLVPTEDTRIRPRDQLVVVSTEEAQIEVEKRIQLLSEGGRLARWYRDEN